ncbi:putative helicase [Trypanosoma rangeli]|uniref:Putative helicase n=1 Tax=Trypanosoma rangeli TaxID=5698 RepID=A0A422NPH5_TRYRA|nr:putative helicase [Trypanosoma rangeli]RNF07393.1 putative helicase [Trypanosoma rangeli]|eukprot:RNF07393.1 putative helicase [Trypanosoma rangeli]
MQAHEGVEERLLALLYDDDTEHDTQVRRGRDLEVAFAAALFDIIGASERASRAEMLACIRRSVNCFIEAPIPAPLEIFFLRVAAMLHCYSVVSSEKLCSSSLPAGTKTAAMAIAGAFFSRRLRAACVEPDKEAEGNNNDNTNKSAGSEAGEADALLQGLNSLWFCFLCVFLQQLSAKGGDFTAWQQFFRHCAAQQQTTTVTDPTTHACTQKAEDGGDSVGDSRTEQLALAAWGAVSEETFKATVARTRFRRTAILCKSFCLHLVAQAPGTTYQLLHTLRSFMSEWARLKKESCGENAVNGEELIVGRYSEQLGRLLGEGQVHSFLLSTAIGAVLSSTYILSNRGIRGGETTRWHLTRADTAWESETHWRQTHFPPIGRLLERLHIREFIGVHLFTFCMQLCIGLSPTHHTEGRQKLAIYFYLTDVCSLRVALAIYHFAASQLPQSTLEAAAMVFPGEGLASLTAAVDEYVQKAYSELIFSAVDAGSTRRRQRHSAAALNNGGHSKEEERIPVNGELTGPRFSKMVFPVPSPKWGQYLAEATATGATTTPIASAATATTTTSPSRVSAAATGAFVKQAASAQSVMPCRFALELCEMGLPGLMAETITQMRAEMGINVCLVPSVAMPGAGSIPRRVLQRIQTFLCNKEKVKEADRNNNKNTLGRYAFSAPLRALEAYFPLLSTICAYVASQDFLCSLVETLTGECAQLLNLVHAGTEAEAEEQKQQEEPHDVLNAQAEARDYAVTSRLALGLAERYLIRVVMPCMRVLAPSPILYSRVQVLLLLMKEKGPVVKFGTTSAEFLHMDSWLHWLLRPSSVCYRAPHDALRSKELEALFTQSLKRMTQSNVAHYKKVLQPVIYANPLLVAEKLFQQAVGYGNNFLQLHTQLLKGAPAAILTLVTHEGLLIMRRYAEAERIGSADANRVGLIATFLSVLWRDNSLTFDGGVLLRAAEYALRREARASIVFGLELLQSILHEMLGFTFEHEEQYSVAQAKAFLTPSTTQWFAKGAAESFRRGRWDTFFTPALLGDAASRLRLALQEKCYVPVEKAEPEEREEEKEAMRANMHQSSQTQHDETGAASVNFTLGQCLLLHLCRLHSRIYTVQADLAGTMQLVLLTCARDYNVINDLLLCMETLLPVGPPEDEVFMVAMPHIALRITARFAVKEVQRKGSSGKPVSSVDALFNVAPFDVMGHVETAASVKTINGVIPFSILRTLSHYTAAHFVFDESVYIAASKEVNQFYAHATALVRANTNAGSGPGSGGGGGGGSNSNSNSSGIDKNINNTGSKLSSDPSIRWLQEQTRQIRLEKEAHQALYKHCEGAQGALLDDLRRSGVLLEPVAFATSYLLPRALLSLEDTLFVYHFMKWLLDTSRTSGSEGRVSEDYNCVVDVVLSLVTAIMTFFVGFTDGECKRVGLLLALLRAALHDTVVEVPSHPSVSDTAVAPTAGGTTDVATSPLTLTTEALMALLEPKPRTLTSISAAHATVAAAAAAATAAPGSEAQAGAMSPGEKDTVQEMQAEVPAFTTQLDAYLCRALVHILLHQRDVPFLHRNAFLVLERLTKNTPVFPSTLCATNWLMQAITPHAVRSSTCYASAMAVLKVLKDNQHRMKETLDTLVTQHLTSTGLSRERGAEKEVEAWYQLWKTREAYASSLLVEDIAAAERLCDTDVVAPAASDVMGLPAEEVDEGVSADAEEVGEPPEAAAAAAEDDDAEEEDEDEEEGDYANGISVEHAEELGVEEPQEAPEDDEVATDRSESRSSSSTDGGDNAGSNVYSQPHDEDAVEEELLATGVCVNDAGLSVSNRLAQPAREGEGDATEQERKRGRDEEEEEDASAGPPRRVTRLELPTNAEGGGYLNVTARHFNISVCVCVFFFLLLRECVSLFVSLCVCARFFCFWGGTDRR